jgi:hypothetical protein
MTMLVTMPKLILGKKKGMDASAWPQCVASAWPARRQYH